MVKSTPHVHDRGLWRYIRFFENPVDFINSPVYRDGCEFSVIFPENPVGLAGMLVCLGTSYRRKFEVA